MRKIVTPEQMRAIDQYMIQTMQIPGIVLMENAASGVTQRILERFPKGKAMVFCGMGNNGGDGLAVARQMMSAGMEVSVAVLGDPERFSGDAASNYAFFDALDDCVARIETNEDIDFFFSQHQNTDVVVDAIFGTGLKRSPDGIFQYAIDQINSSGKYIVSVDMPSGVDGATGRVLGNAVRADETVTFQYAKVGHYVYPGADYCGKLTVHTIGYDEGCQILRGMNLFVSEPFDDKIVIGKKERNTNKGSFGRLLLTCGSKGMAGAAVLCAKAAVHMGSGLTTMASCGYVTDVLQDSVPEVMTKVLGQSRNYIDADADSYMEELLEKYTAIAIGPGIGQNPELMDLIMLILEKDIPKVLDADALNILALNPAILQNRKNETIVTPHPGEMARLTQSSIKEVLDNPVETARNFAFRYGVITVLKGASTVVAAPTGYALIVPQGTAGMAKGGSGDVLTGILGALLAQGYEGFAAAALGVYLNAVAGEIAAEKYGEYSMTAEDTVSCLKDAIQRQLRDISRGKAKDQIEELALIHDSFQKIEPSPHLEEFQTLLEFGKDL